MTSGVANFTSHTNRSAPEESGEIDINIDTTGTLEFITAGESFEARIELFQEIAEANFEYVVYFRDNTIYINAMEAMGINISTPKVASTPLSLVNFDLNFSETDILTQSAEATDSGYRLMFTLGTDAVLLALEEQLNERLEAEEINDYEYVVTIILDQDRMMARVETEITVSHEVDDGEYEFAITTSVEIEEDDSISFEIPDELDDIIEMPEDSITLPMF